MLDCIYYMSLKLLKITFWREYVKVLSSFTQRYNGCSYVSVLNW